MANSVHSFSTTFNKNGNITITFYEGSKRRDIKLISGTQAHSDYATYHHSVGESTYPGHSDESITTEALIYLRQDFIFKKHENNSSVFYPRVKQ